MDFPGLSAADWACEGILTKTMVARKKARPAPAVDAASLLQDAIHALGNYSHVTVRAVRSHLNVYVEDDEDAVARFTPLGAGNYGLSFHTQTGRWEPMPFTGQIREIAQALVSALGAFIEPDLSRRNNGSDH